MIAYSQSYDPEFCELMERLFEEYPEELFRIEVHRLYSSY